MAPDRLAPQQNNELHEGIYSMKRKTKTNKMKRPIKTIESLPQLGGIVTAASREIRRRCIKVSIYSQWASPKGFPSPYI
jgi:hypothetical protein